MDTTGLSRSEIRQLEQIKASEAKEAAKNKPAEPKQQGSVAKKTTPSRPAESTPRATTGGKTMGAKGRAAAGGKSTGGKRPPQQASKKRKAGKKKKDDSSSSSSEDDDDSSSASSEEEREEVAAKMPLKKRGKLAPATPRAADSSEESSEFEEEFDKDFFKNEEDRQWLMSLTEVDREGILAERQDRQAIAREAWQMSHQNKKAGKLAAATRAPGASLARGRREKEKSDKNAEKRAALEDMEARKVEQQQKRMGRVDVMEEESDEEPRKRQSQESVSRDSSRKESAKPRHRQVPQVQQETFATLPLEEVEALRVKRDQLVEYANCPFFGEFVVGLYVRCFLGVDQHDRKRYLVCRVIGVKDKAAEYEIHDTSSGKTVTLRKHLTVAHASQKKTYPIAQVSNAAFSPEEVTKWCRDMHKDGEKLPDEEEMEEIKKKLAKQWKQEFIFDTDTVQSILDEREKARQGVAAGNVFQTKMKLQDDMDIAWEAYKELQQQGSEEEKAEAYKKWEDLKRQVEIYDEAVEKTRRNAEEQAARHKVINARNMSANRTVTKTIDSARNITCTRPYRQTVYFAFGESEATNKLATDDRFTGHEMKQQKPAKHVLAPEEIVKVDDDDDDAPVGGPAAAGGQADTHTTDEAASALERAHINLSLQVDAPRLQKVGNEDVVLPFARAPNPLRPTDTPAPAVSAGTKNKLSLEDYKRRRGLL